MKKITLFLSLLFLIPYAYSQQGWQPGFLKQLYSTETFKDRKTSEKITGSPYLDDNFVAGVIKDSLGNSQDAYFRYNALEDIVEIKIQNAGKTEIRVLPKIRTLTYIVDDHKFIFDNFRTNKGEEIKNYLIEYFKGDSYALYGHPLPNVSIAQVPKTPYGSYKPPHLSIREDFYIQKEDGLLHNIKLRDKDIEKILPKSKELNNYLAKNKLESPQDYAKLLQWLENLNLSESDL